MRYKLLGSSGLRVSEMALGTMAFSEDWGWGADRDECRRIVDAYREGRSHRQSHRIDRSGLPLATPAPILERAR
ncbi:MAG TPA: hypothetical protein VFH80_04715 [Solirubrobacteraceae bacterium]|nr:hypothetical protein [Solirubrobacteraceae bacterium]